ncbi:MAG: hypothetical protein COT81_01000 [Candidatus Buchananbacteria bacterium CG10_big_fil_rev_8_21_14_0_10_42_9]|uniref:PhoU domain-containing protein n=1 Tax=Candidatus Buchananbacteria bacterium CG10_big_fil_rev_8_21_14_0_10_42_9 TaxID=1974526 RepID=A0A2H0W267_9BACT|nr:MAG: hypothetical protein COT81_01000 [Candidatus Buchananbacteria bacterium CG10_big_fil_rev_8_21_14_0_10_42_9]
MMQTVIFYSLGGLALLFFGMREMSDGLQKVAGDKLKRVLHFFTKNRLFAVLAGLAITTLFQSSSATTILIVGFVNAQLLSLTQAIGVIMGANIGTTITAWLVSAFSVFKITQYTLPAIALGIFLMHFAKLHKTRYWGQFIFGFGILFLGLGFMKDAFEPLEGSQLLKDFFVYFSDYPILGVLAGIIFTIILQSSSATIAILQLLALKGLISFDAALPILIGDNIGTTITAQLAAYSVRSTNARRAANAHSIFNLVGAAWALPLVYFGIFSSLVRTIVPVEVTAASVTLLIAVSHTFFNVFNTILFLPFVSKLEVLVLKLTPRGNNFEYEGPRYLDKNLLHSSSLSIEAVVREIKHMLGIAKEVFELSIDGFRRNQDNLRQVSSLEKNVDTLQVDIFRYLTLISQTEMNANDAKRMPRIYHTVNDVEKISDYGERLMILQQRLESVYDEGVIKYFQKISEYTLVALRELIYSLDDDKDGQAHAQKVLGICGQIKSTAENLQEQHLQRLSGGVANIAVEQVLGDAINIIESARRHIKNVAEARLSGKLMS